MNIPEYMKQCALWEGSMLSLLVGTKSFESELMRVCATKCRDETQGEREFRNCAKKWAKEIR